MANAPAEISVKDTDGRFVVINRELERLFGVTSEKAEGKTFRDFGPEHLAASFEASDRAVMESRQAIQVLRHTEWALAWIAMSHPA